ncbi:MAG: hypothetical protein H6746_08505 [Deltaproteobacteria bacterium]|nr:hypothetical protein [Deltaproteobacteria bacterium]
MNPTSSRPRAFGLLAAMLLLALPAHAADDAWKRHGGDCDDSAFAKPEATPLDAIARCVKLFQAYQNPDTVTGDYRGRVVTAMKRLYVAGSEQDAHVAKLALARLGETELPERVVAAPKPAQPVAPPRKKCDVPTPDKAALKKANAAFKKGYAAYKKGKYDQSLERYLDAVAAAPGWPKGRYNAAAMYAMTGDAKSAVESLRCLQDIGDDASIEYLKKARTDTDFASIRSTSAEFKEVTGYAKIKLGNGLGELGEDNVDNIEASMEKLGYPITEITETGKPYAEPHIWYKPECMRAAYFLIKVMNHPDTRTHRIDWDNEDYDVIVAWGDTVEKGKEPRMRVQDPADAEKKMDDLRREENALLAKPEDAANKVENVVEAPERMGDKATKGVERAGRTVEKIQNVGEKIKGIVP